MKKIFALTVAILLMSKTSALNASAEDDDLKSLAASLGAETDHLDILNYYHDEEHPLYSENLDQYSEQCSNVEGHTDFIDFSSAISSGMCFGISAIEVLSHNGVIKPSDIKAGADNLCDIGYDKESDYFITAFSAAQGHFEQDKYFKYLKSSFTYQQQAQIVIDTAEKCMAEKRYFLLMYDDLQSFHHAVAGIGIMDGEWEFDGKKYDKCVLTLDCNIISKDTGKLSPFHEKSCLYIDTETLEYYIPAYDLSSGEGGVYLAAVKCRIMITDNKYGETEPELNDLKLTSVGNILLKYNNDELDFYIDSDKDGKYDSQVQKGDVNSDGIIDGRDATAILTSYALSSAQKEYLSFVNSDIADYNDDGIVDGRDASAVLTYYAKQSDSIYLPAFI